MRKKILGQKGQSSIEFIMSLIFTFALMGFAIHLSINTAVGYIVHYATFVASRTFLVANSNDEQNDNAAMTTARASFDRVIGIPGKNSLMDFHSVDLMESSGGLYEYIGVYTKFSRKMAPRGSPIASNVNVQFISESYLGREPTRRRCWERVCEIMQSAYGPSCAPNPGQSPYFATLFDNGC